MKFRLLPSAMIACMLFAVCCLSASAQPAASDMVTTPRPDSEDPQWGEMVEGLQMHAEFDSASLTVTCMIRNGSAVAVGYNEYFLGSFDNIWIEMKCDTGWQNVRYRISDALSAGPSHADNRVVQPGTILPVTRRNPAGRSESFPVYLKIFDWPDSVAEHTPLEFRVVHAVGSYIYNQYHAEDRWHYLQISSLPIRIDDPVIIHRLAGPAQEEQQ